MTTLPDVERIDAAARAVRERCGEAPATAIVLGSGLGAVADSLHDASAVGYDELPYWPVPEVIGHAGRLVVGTMAGRRVAALSGRVHVYEGHDLSAVVFAVRVMARLGVQELILTNAAGGINTGMSSGVLMVIDDHINLLGGNPLAGPNDDRLGPRFPDMSEVYSARLRQVADQAARSAGVPLAHGVYAAVPGPSYETPAEIRYLRAIGADAVGMSTVPEAITARHMGMAVLGISCITNMAAGVSAQPFEDDEVLETARRARGSFVTLLEGIIERL
jgi:purine-nucleoside phosphorylase